MAVNWPGNDDWKKQARDGMKRLKIENVFLKTLINLLITAIFGGLYFYLQLPAINLHDPELYVFALLLCLIYVVCALITSGFSLTGGASEYFAFVRSQCKVPGILAVALLATALVGALIGAALFRAADYRDLLTVTPGDFASEVTEISFDKIPMLDSDSALRLGNRKLGELADMVSQFEVSEEYTQINYQSWPVRVTPLIYGDLIKWFNNRSSGLPAYVIVDMVTQAVDVIRLPEGMKYSTNEHFGRNLYRHLRFSYPTFMFDNPTFEIDDNGHPYWVCPRVVKTIGLFGGTDINGAVLVDAVTGASWYYPAAEVPQWVDRVYTAELIIEQYDYHGTFVNGFINSVLGQKGVTVTTEGYNYIAMNDDVYMYTGITSVGADESNVGFILSNQRTKETRYYPVAGAEEFSAMSSAEGVVQHLNYVSTFPLLLNISGEPTYFMALKDYAELVKMYAMVNVRQYQIVATGVSLAECEREYIRLMAENGLVDGYGRTLADMRETAGVIAEIRTAVAGGNSYYYFRLDGDSHFYVISVAEDPTAVIFNVGDFVTLQISEDGAGGELRTLHAIRRT